MYKQKLYTHLLPIKHPKRRHAFLCFVSPKILFTSRNQSDVQALDVLLLIIVLRKGLLVHFNFCFLVVSAKLALIFLNTKKKFKKCKQSENKSSTCEQVMITRFI